MRMVYYFHRNIAAMSITLSLNLMILIYSAYAGSGAANHERAPVHKLMSEALALEGDVDSLESELAKIDSRRAGTETLKEELASECLKLLRTYSAPEEQGKIYAEVAHIYGQSGRKEPSKIIKYVEKALEYPLEPGTKAGLYIYWGDAIQIESSIKGQDFTNARKKAVKPYLEGLKFVLSYDLPDKKPELPSVNIFTYDGPKSDPVYQEMFKEHERQWKVRKEAESLNDMIQHRDVLIGQIVYLYTRYPFATAELEELLKQTLGDKHKSQIDKIIQKVKEDINIRLCGHIPIQLDEAITILKEAHLEMKRRNDSGEYCLALAIDPGDTETRQPTRFWIFDYSPITGYLWVTYPRSLPGVYTKLTSMTVNGHYPMEYLTENGELISMREGPDVIAHPSEPILISYGSTTAELELRDDSGEAIKIVLSPQ